MKSTIKFNQKNIPKFFWKFVPIASDLRDLLNVNDISREEFSNYMLSVYNGKKIFKSTGPLRHKLSNEILLKTTENIGPAVIIDIGASDGSTSLDIIEKTKSKFAKYYVTDISFYLCVNRKKGNTYFYDPDSKKCLIMVNDYFIIFKDEHADLNPLRIVGNYFISRAPAFDAANVINCSLCQPDLIKLAENDPRIIIKGWNIFNKWDGEKADIIKAANILNRAFFSDIELTNGIKNIKEALKENGYLLVVENRHVEKYTLFKKTKNGLVPILSRNGGTEILDLLA